MKSTNPQISLRFQAGTIAVSGLGDDIGSRIQVLVRDDKIPGYRGHAYYYRRIVSHLYNQRLIYDDQVRKYHNLKFSATDKHFVPFEYQEEALAEWAKAKWGTVVLPTGSGKSILAGMAIRELAKSAIVIVPTIDLLFQWKKNLMDFLGTEIGVLGGGENQILDITVSTYDSAGIYANTIGNRFCLTVFDECHHLPSPANAHMARAFIAPYRLGLTATPTEETDPNFEHLADLTGRIVYRKEIQELAGSHLSPYEIRTINVNLNQQERDLYERERGKYLDYKKKLVGWGALNPDRWEDFVILAGRTEEGRAALKSFHAQKHISVSAEGKFEALKNIMLEHSDDKILVFTHDNHTAYLISATFFLPLITHETVSKERKKILSRFRSGEWPYLVSSRVLNEGVDMPDANVAVIVSGTGTVREHVQRLGRILRKKTGKKAYLYELITTETGEVYTSQRRRMHSAYNPLKY